MLPLLMEYAYLFEGDTLFIAVTQRDYQEDPMVVERAIRKILVTISNTESKKTSPISESLVPTPEFMKYLKIRNGQINRKETENFSRARPSKMHVQYQGQMTTNTSISTWDIEVVGNMTLEGKLIVVDNNLSRMR